LSDLLLAVISEPLPSDTIFCLREIVLKEMCPGQKDIIQAYNIENLNDPADQEKSQEELPEVIAVVYTVHSSTYKNANI